MPGRLHCVKRVSLFFVGLFPLCSQVVTPTFPGVFPASLNVFADQGDLTYCQTVAVRGSVPAFTLTCRRAGVTYFTSTVIKSSGIHSNGDVTFAFNWDAAKPSLVHVQASVNVRDPLLTELWLDFGTVPRELSIGEILHDPARLKGGTVLHWTHSAGTVLHDGITQESYGGQLTLSNLLGTFAPGDLLQDGNNGAVGTVGRVSAITSNQVKSAFDVEWTPASSSRLRRIWRAVAR